MYVYICKYIHIYIYIYGGKRGNRKSERESERERKVKKGIVACRTGVQGAAFRAGEKKERGMGREGERKRESNIHLCILIHST
jgi:hypothetical protein